LRELHACFVLKWSLRRGPWQVCSLAGVWGGVSSLHLAFSPDGKRIVSGKDGRLQIWNGETGVKVSDSLPVLWGAGGDVGVMWDVFTRCCVGGGLKRESALADSHATRALRGRGRLFSGWEERRLRVRQPRQDLESRDQSRGEQFYASVWKLVGCWCVVLLCYRASVV